MPHLHETVRLEGGIELRAKAGGGHVQPNREWARQWAAKGIETKPNKAARAQLETAPAGAGTMTAAPVPVEPEPAQRFLAEKILAACAGHLWCSVPQLQFVRAFPGNPTGRAKYAGGTVYLRVDQHGEDLVEAAAHELAHHYCAKVATRHDAGAAENAEQYAADYGLTVKRAWLWHQQHGAGLDFGYALKTHTLRLDPAGV